MVRVIVPPGLTLPVLGVKLILEITGSVKSQLGDPLTATDPEVLTGLPTVSVTKVPEKAVNVPLGASAAEAGIKPPVAVARLMTRLLPLPEIVFPVDVTTPEDEKEPIPETTQSFRFPKEALDAPVAKTTGSE